MNRRFCKPCKRPGCPCRFCLSGFALYLWIVAAIFLSVLALPAKTIYVAQSAAGNDDGASAGNAHSAAWFNTASNWNGGATTVLPGDTVMLSGTISSGLTAQGSGVSNSPIVILFDNGAKLSAPTFTNASPVGGPQALLIQRRGFVTVDGGTNGIIECTDNGSPGYFTYANSVTGIRFFYATNGTVKNLTFRNLYQAVTNETPAYHPGSAVQLLGNNLSAVSNTVCYVAYGFSVVFYNTHDIEVAYNIISRCGGGIIVGIGADGYQGTNVWLHHNRIWNTSDWGYNDGIKFFARPATKDLINGARVYDNVIGPNISTPTHPATSWILMDVGWYANVAIYNNLLVGQTNDAPANGYITVGGTHPTYGNGVSPMRAQIYNNTVYTESTTPKWMVLISYPSSGHRIWNNNFYSLNSKMIPLGLVVTNDVVDFCDYNNTYSPLGISENYHLQATYNTKGSAVDPLLAGWNTIRNGVNYLVKRVDYELSLGSPLRTAGANGAMMGIEGLNPASNLRIKTD